MILKKQYWLLRLFSSSFASEQIDLSKEIIGGCINFIAIAYIIIVNPMILNASGHGFPMAPAITSTIIIIILATVLASVVIKLPFVLAPGMGVNAIIGYTLILHDGLDVATALGVVLISSVLLFVISMTQIRELIVHAIPECLQIAISAGIGGFLFFIGVRHTHIIVDNPNTLVSMGKLNYLAVLSLIGFALTATLFIKQKRYAFLLPMIIITVIYMIINPQIIPKHLWQLPDFHLFMQMNLRAALKLSLLPAVLSLFVVNFFDASSTVIGLVGQIKTEEHFHKKYYLKRALFTDSISGIFSGILGSAPVVIFLESSAAIQSGAVTGIAALVTAILCIPFLFFAPIITIIPDAATAPLLMLVGILMLKDIAKLQNCALEDVFAVIVTVVMMPLCFSISDGAIFGVMTYVVLKLLLGKFKQLSICLVVIAIAGAIWFGFGRF